MNIIDKQKFIFGSFFVLANKLQVIGDKYLSADGITTKQWFLSAMLAQFQDRAPTLSEVSELMGSSRQNVKQLALKLEEKDMVAIEKDQQDARALRLRLTEKNLQFWEKRQEQDNRYIEDLFSCLTDEEVEAMFNGFLKLSEVVDKKEKELNKQEKEGDSL